MAELRRTRHGWCFVGDNIDNRLWIVYNSIERARADAIKYNVKFVEKL